MKSAKYNVRKTQFRMRIKLSNEHEKKSTKIAVQNEKKVHKF